MDTVRPYHRGLYRLPVTYPAMYCVVSTVGEGMIVNLSALGCTIETSEPLPLDRCLALRLLLPDRGDSLPIELGTVRWVNGNRAGIEFTQIDRTANLRLHSFVWDQMVGRIQAIHQQRTRA
ncbi:MAG: hypothetical protein GDA67_03185 [Nitrospira sp. CR1.3]|nr:hypothetical protein [Nitrospira sp. CR1.3]